MTPRKAGRSPDAVDAIIAQWQRERPDIDVAGLAIFGRLHRAYLRYAALIGDVFGRYGVNAAAFDVLAALRRSGEPYRRTAGDLASAGLITSGGLTMRLDRLEAAGLITREHDTADRRVVYAQLTPAGLDLIDRLAKEHFSWELEMLAGLTEAERVRLAALLAELDRSMLEAAGRSQLDDIFSSQP